MSKKLKKIKKEIYDEKKRFSDLEKQSHGISLIREDSVEFIEHKNKLFILNERKTEEIERINSKFYNNHWFKIFVTALLSAILTKFIN